MVSDVNPKVQLEGTNVAVAGKLVGKYAAAGRRLESELARAGAVLLDGFELSADLFVVASKAKGFEKRVAKTGKPTIDEPQLEALLAAALSKNAGTKTKGDARRGQQRSYSLTDALRGLSKPSLSPAARRQCLVDVLVEAGTRGQDVGLEGVLTAERFPPVEPDDRGDDAERAEASAVLAWVGAGARLFVIPQDASAALTEDLRRVSSGPLHFGEDCPIRTLGAACRTLVRMGHSSARVWERLRGEYENRDAEPPDPGACCLEDLQKIEPALEPQRLATPEALNFAVSRFFVLEDLTAW